MGGPPWLNFVVWSRSVHGLKWVLSPNTAQVTESFNYGQINIDLHEGDAVSVSAGESSSTDPSVIGITLGLNSDSHVLKVHLVDVPPARGLVALALDFGDKSSWPVPYRFTVFGLLAWPP
jgi:hypothetical protein